jgi:ADP-ribosylglycohydrolase
MTQPPRHLSDIASYKLIPTLAAMAPHKPTSPSQHPFVGATTTDKIFGCIVGSALGDTIGLYTEFLSKEKSAKAYPKRTFSLVEPTTKLHLDRHRSRFEPRGWTDDTDQALLIQLAYLHLKTTKTDAQLSQEFAARLKIWVSKGLIALDRPALGIGALVYAVVSNARFEEDPVRCATDRWIKSSRQAAPNGSLMRTHPIGVIGVNLTEEQTWRLSVSVGSTTHVDPRCTVACCIEVGVIRQLLRGQIQTVKAMDAAIERAYQWVRKQPELMNPGNSADLSEAQIRRHLQREEFVKYVYAETLEELELDAHDSIGYVYKCLGSAIFCLRVALRRSERNSLAVGMEGKAKVFEELMVKLIMEGGDADTNGAAAGALLGAYLGYANLPSHWKLGLAHNEWLMHKTERFAIAVGAVPGELEPGLDEAADGGMKYQK